jgi:hypothetical protein
MSARIIAVDWSGAKTGSARKIALAEANDGELLHIEDRLTREAVVQRLIEASSRDQVIAALDFGFSLPAWYLAQQQFARAHDLWRWLAEGDRADELLRACTDPFWGPKGRTRPQLENHFRITEGALRDRGIGPKSVFQIAGAGAVGTGSIRGMPELHRLNEAGFAIWPFDAASFPLALEIYPRSFYKRRLTKSHLVDRESYVDEEVRVPENLKQAVAKTEDTFDAAISAIGMSRHAAALESLPVIEDPQLRIEGIIWWPGWQKAHGL